MAAETFQQFYVVYGHRLIYTTNLLSLIHLNYPENHSEENREHFETNKK